jgi:hypothetical protein
MSYYTVSLEGEDVERRKLWFRPGGEKPLFKLHLEVEIWFGKVF